MRTPYSEAEAIEARQFVARYGPANAWTATAGTAARIIGRLLKERRTAISQAAIQIPAMRDVCAGVIQ
jgi:hypothetical protein